MVGKCKHRHTKVFFYKCSPSNLHKRKKRGGGGKKKGGTSNQGGAKKAAKAQVAGGATPNNVLPLMHTQAAICTHSEICVTTT